MICLLAQNYFLCLFVFVVMFLSVVVDRKKAEGAGGRVYKGPGENAFATLEGDCAFRDGGREGRRGRMVVHIHKTSTTFYMMKKLTDLVPKRKAATSRLGFSPQFLPPS